MQQLIDEHDGIRAGVAALRALLVVPTIPERAGFSTARFTISSRIRQHFASEDRLLYAPLIADPRRADMARSWQAEFAALMATYSEHTRHWTPDRIAGGWGDYRQRSLTLIDRLCARLLREERELFPLLGR